MNTPEHAVLVEYEHGLWKSRIVSGAEVAAVESWLREVEARPRLPGPVSAKPLTWLHLTGGGAPSGSSLRAVRSVGLLTEVLRALDRPLESRDLEVLRDIFERHGTVFHGRVDPP